MRGKQMQVYGGVAVVSGFLLWFGGEIAQIQPFNVLGIPILFTGAFVYFRGKRQSQ